MLFRSLGQRRLSCLQYADDLVILSESRAGLQRCLDKLNVYCNKWKLEINKEKSTAMVISKTGKKPKDFINVGNSSLENVSTYTYLGMTISSNGKFSKC